MDDKEKIEFLERIVQSKDLYSEGLRKQIELQEKDLIELRKAKDRDALKFLGDGIFKGTEIGEKAPGESLYFHPTYHHKNNLGQIGWHTITVAPVKGMVYLGGYESYEERNLTSGCTSFWLTREETMILIKGLAEAVEMIEKGEE